VQIGVAHAAGLNAHAHQDLARPGVINNDFFQLGRSPSPPRHYSQSCNRNSPRSLHDSLGE
jgi:hypothetical protein